MKIYNTGKKILVHKLNAYFKKMSKGQKILDLGCGTGDLVRYLAEKFKHLNFIGIDVHGPTLNYARQFHLKNTQYIKSNERTIPLKNNSVDFVYSTSVIEHVSNDRLFVKEIYRVLKKNGYTVVTAPNRNVIPLKGANPDHKRHYIPKELKKLLESAGFKVLEIYYRWPSFSRKIDSFLDNFKNKFFKPKAFQPCITAISKKEKENLKTNVLFFCYDLIIDPIVTLITFLDYKLNAKREKFDIAVICQKK